MFKFYLLCISDTEESVQVVSSQEGSPISSPEPDIIVSSTEGEIGVESDAKEILPPADKEKEVQEGRSIFCDPF